MLLYATPLTYDRLHIKPSEALHYAADHIYPQYDFISSVKENEAWSEIYEWFVELFYFNGVKYLRTVHISSGFTLFFKNVDEAFMAELGFRIRTELLKYYINDSDMTEQLQKFFSDSFLNFYVRIKNKGRLDKYNLKKTAFNTKNHFYSRFISNNAVDTVALNKSINTDCSIYRSGKNTSSVFKEQLSEFYSNDNNSSYHSFIRHHFKLNDHEINIYAKG